MWEVRTGLWLVKLIAYQTPFFEAWCINFLAECPLEIKGTDLFECSLDVNVIWGGGFLH